MVGLDDYLYERMIYVGRNRIHLKECDSTNNELKRLFSVDDLAQGTLLTTDYQLGGKGQMGAGWQSNVSENFLGTFLFKLKVKIESIFILNVIAALAVKATVEEITGNLADIKWPNDVLVKCKKIAGILIETKKIQFGEFAVFMGLGLNVNQLVINSTGRSATSLRRLIKKDVEMNVVIKTLCFHLQQFVSLYEAKGAEPLNYLYHQCLYLKGKKARYVVGREELNLVLQQVNEAGEAVFISEDNQLISFGLKQIKFIQ